MKYVEESSLKFAFDDEHTVFKYDDSRFYLEHFQQMRHTQAVDIICITNDAAWLIEVKNYRDGKGGAQVEPAQQTQDAVQRTKPNTECVVAHLIQQVRDTLAGLAAAQTDSNDDVASRDVAREALRRRQWRVAFHIEGLDKFTQYHLAGIHTKLKKQIKPIDQKAIVMSTRSSSGRVPWTATSIPK